MWGFFVALPLKLMPKLMYSTSLGKLLLSAFLLSSAILLTLLVYWPGLSGSFLLDDFHNLEPLGHSGGVTSWNHLLDFVFGNGSGSGGRPVSMISFLLNDQYWPSNPWSFKYTNLLIHVICGLLVILLTIQIGSLVITNRAAVLLVAFFCGTIWMLHPLNVSTTLYVIQRMTQLSALFLLSGLVVYLSGRIRIGSRPRISLVMMTAGLCLFGLLSFFSKENGVLFLLYILVLEVTILSRTHTVKYAKIWLALFIGLPLLLGGLYVITHWQQFYSGYLARSFSLEQRLLTEARVLFIYIGHILIPRTSGMTLFGDFIPISTGLLSPPSTLISILMIASLLTLALALRKKHPVFAFAVLWFFSGHLLESTFLPLELYFEHRNYSPMIGPLFGACYYLYAGIDRLRPSLKRWLLAAPLLIVAMLAFMTHGYAKAWGNTAAVIASWATQSPLSIRSQVQLAHLQGGMVSPEEGFRVLTKLGESYPNELSVPIHILSIACLHGVDPQLDIEGIISSANRADYFGGLEGKLRGLAEQTVDEGCPYLTREQFHRLLYGIEGNPKARAKMREIARIHYLHADLFVEEMRLDPAMDQLNKALRLQPTVDINIRAAVLLGSAGLYEEALVYLDQARLADASRRRFRPSRVPEIDFLQRALTRSEAPAVENPDTELP